MSPTLISKVAVRLPNFISLFFSVMLVTGFRLLGDHFHWIAAPRFSLANWNDVLVVGNFVGILCFVITAWIGLSVLLERDQYTLSFSRFFFDIGRFALMFALIMWSFLSGKPGYYHIFVLGLAAYHLLLVLWYVFNIRSHHQQSHFSVGKDLVPHIIPLIIYLILGIFYHITVMPPPVPDAGAAAAPEAAAPMPAVHIATVLLTMLVIISWCTWRLNILKKRLVDESALAMVH